MEKRKFTQQKIRDNRSRIKQYFTREDLTAEDVAQQVHEKYPDANPSGMNLSRKLARGTLRSIEEVEIADVLGYDIVWVKRK